MNCGHCSGLMIPDPLDGGTVCCSCGRRTPQPPPPQRWPGRLPPRNPSPKTEKQSRDLGDETR